MILWPRLREYVELSANTLREAESFTERELDGGCVIPGSLRNRSQEARAQQAAFWAEYERKQAEKAAQISVARKVLAYQRAPHQPERTGAA